MLKILAEDGITLKISKQKANSSKMRLFFTYSAYGVGIYNKQQKLFLRTLSMVSTNVNLYQSQGKQSLLLCLCYFLINVHQ